MSKFLEKLVKIFLKLRGYSFVEKFLNHIVSIYGGKNGDVLDNISKVTNNAVQSIELFEDIVKEKLETVTIIPDEEIKALIEEVKEENHLSPFDVIRDFIYLQDLVKVLEEEKAQGGAVQFGDIFNSIQDVYKKGDLKFKIARDIIVRDLKANKVEYTVQLVVLAIDTAVVKFFNKNK